MFEEVLPSFCKTGSYELQALKNKLMLKDKQIEIKDNKLNKAMMQVTLKDEEWFCGRDVCEILEFKNSNQTLPDRVQSRFEITERGTVGLYHPLISQCGKGCIHLRTRPVSIDFFVK